MPNNSLNPAILLLQKVATIVTKPGDFITLTCPNCRGRASGGKNERDGKLYAYCGECGTAAQE